MKKLLKILFDPRLQLVAFAGFGLALQAFIWLISPENGTTLLYKLAQPILAAIVGFLCDRIFFPYAAPDSYLDDDWRKNLDADNPEDADYPIAVGYYAVFCAACLRRALIMGVFILGVCLAV